MNTVTDIPAVVNNFSEINITITPTLYSPEDFRTIPLSQALDDAQNGTYADKVATVRAEMQAHGKGAKYKRLKSYLGSWVFAGTFRDSIENVNLEHHSQLLHFDIDGILDSAELPDKKGVDALFKRLADDVHTVFLFRSPSNAGLKGAFWIDKNLTSDADHKKAFYAVEKYMLDEYEVTIDPSCKDVRRYCYVSYDPGLYRNEAAKAFCLGDNWRSAKPKKKKQKKARVTKKVPRAEKSKSGTLSIDMLDRCAFLSHCRETAVDLPEPDWFEAICNLVNSRYTNSEDIIHEISRVYPEYAEAETQDKIDHAKTQCAHKCISLSWKCPEIATCPFNQPYEALDATDEEAASKRRALQKAQGFGQEAPEMLVSDMSLAAGFAERLRGRGRYDHSQKAWYNWTGTQWAVDNSGSIPRMAQKFLSETSNALQVRGFIEADDDSRKAGRYFSAATTCRSKYKRDNVIDYTASQEGVPVDHSAFDTDGWLFNCANGIIDLKTGELKRHDPELLQSKISPTSFDDNADCEKWLKFLDEIFDGDQEVIGFTKRLMGYCLTGSQAEQVIGVLYGNGSNGKGVFTSVIAGIMGDYWQNTQFETFTASDGGGNEKPRYDLAALAGARYVTASEGDRGAKLSEGTVKSCTGGDPQTCRFPHGRFFTYKPQYKILLSTNYRPRIIGQDYGIWRRVMLIPFNRQFRGEAVNKNLKMELSAESSGILKWLVEGCLEWQKVGLNPPKAVLAATKEYKADMDVLGGFFTDCCNLDDQQVCTKGLLYDAYAHHAFTNEAETILSKRSFGRILRERGYHDKKSGSSRSWIGIGLKVTWDTLKVPRDTTEKACVPKNPQYLQGFTEIGTQGTQKSKKLSEDTKKSVTEDIESRDTNNKLQQNNLHSYVPCVPNAEISNDSGFLTRDTTDAPCVPIVSQAPTGGICSTCIHKNGVYCKKHREGISTERLQVGCGDWAEKTLVAV